MTTRHRPRRRRTDDIALADAIREASRRVALALLATRFPEPRARNVYAAIETVVAGQTVAERELRRRGRTP